MKKTIASLFVFASATTMAQVPLNSVVEHFTNTKCSICASRNPGFHSNVVAHPEVTLLSIHPSAPYSSCILSIQNKTDNDDRTKWHGVFGGTPRLSINGIAIAASANYNDHALFAPYLGLTSPISMRVEQNNFGTDSIKAKVVIKKVAATASDARLFIALVEDTIFVNGGNGETKHYNVLRKSLTGAAPQSVSIATLPVGDSIIVEMTGTANSFWDMKRMFAMAIVHENSTNKVLQSEKSMPFKTAMIGTISKEIKFNYSPNPAVNSLTISAASNDMFNYKLYNMLGVSVAQNTFINTTNINVANLPNGFYILKLVSDNGAAAQQKILVQH